jgi:hypothetical protein
MVPALHDQTTDPYRITINVRYWVAARIQAKINVPCKDKKLASSVQSTEPPPPATLQPRRPPKNQHSNPLTATVKRDLNASGNRQSKRKQTLVVDDTYPSPKRSRTGESERRSQARPAQSRSKPVPAKPEDAFMDPVDAFLSQLSPNPSVSSFAEKGEEAGHPSDSIAVIRKPR